MQTKRVTATTDRETGPRGQQPNLASQAALARASEGAPQRTTALDSPDWNGSTADPDMFDGAENSVAIPDFGDFQTSAPDKAPDSGAGKLEQRKKAASVIEAHLSELGNGDQRLNRDDIVPLASQSGDPEVRNAARFYSDNPDALNDLNLPPEAGAGDRVSVDEFLARHRQR